MAPGSCDLLGLVYNGSCAAMLWYGPPSEDQAVQRCTTGPVVHHCRAWCSAGVWGPILYNTG